MNEELIAYYVNLLIIQYADKQNARLTIEAMVRSGMVYDLIIAIRDGFNIETAIGDQLDILGKYIGISRVVTGTAFDREYFGYALYGEYDFNFNPYIKYESTIPDVQFRRYEESNQSIYTLNNEEYRIMLKLGIVKNYSNGSVMMIDDMLHDLFADEVIFTDRLNMTVSYIIEENNRRTFQIAKGAGLLPAPAAVSLVTSFVSDVHNIFAFGQYGIDPPDFAVGYSVYGDTDIIGGWAQYGET